MKQAEKISGEKENNSREIVRIKKLQVNAYTISTETPVESDGTIEWNATTLVLVELSAGNVKGIGYTYADQSAAAFILSVLKHIVIGMNAMNIPAISAKMISAIRNNGNTGIAMMAVSAVDNALWDLKAKLLELPLCLLLGQARESMKLYGSGGFTSYDKNKLQQQLSGWAEEGFEHVKIKIGREPSKDVQRVEWARKAIGENVHLFVDANGAYNIKQAIDKANEFSAYSVSWFEEPVTSDNLSGLQNIKNHVAAPMQIAAGEYGYNIFYFKNMLEAGSVDVLQADATRCGGISNFIIAAHLAAGFQIPFSSHCAPALHLHAALSIPEFYIAEYFYDHARIEYILFDGISPPVNGLLKPNLQLPGLGLEFKYADAEKYKI